MADKNTNNKKKRRLDSNRIALKAGESQRPNGTYCYRYRSRDGKTHAIYAKTLEDINNFIEKNNEDNLVLRNCVAVIKDLYSDDNDKLTYIKDIFEHVYNNEIVVIKDFSQILDGEGFELEYLGNKVLKELKNSTELYKLKY